MAERVRGYISRRRFLARCGAAATLVGLSAAGVACQAPATPAGGAPGSVPPGAPAGAGNASPGVQVTASTAPAALALKGVSEVTQVAKLLGENAINDTPARWGLYGADLGSMFDLGDRLYMVFGDSFGCCIPGTGGPGGAGDWRSNTMAVIADRDPRDGLTFEDMITDRPGHAAQLLGGGPEDVTVIPTYGTGLGDRMYLHYMAVAQWGQPGYWTLNRAGLAYSDDRGHTWTMDPNLRWAGDSNFGQVAFVKFEDLLYLFGIPGGRHGAVKLARVEQGSVLDKAAYRYFAGLQDGSPEWSPLEERALAIAGPPVGELSVIWNAFLGRWIMTYLDEDRAELVIREAPRLWGPWSEALLLASSKDYPSPYGAYMHPWYVEANGEIIYFAMSMWGPYAVFWMRARLIRA